MKILVTAPNLITGGAEKQLIYLIEGLVKNGFEIVLFLLELEGEYLGRVPTEVRVISPVSRRPGKTLKGLWKIREVMRAISVENPDILYSRLWPTKVATAIAGRLAGKRVVFSEDRTLTAFMNERGRRKLNLDSKIKREAARSADTVVPVSNGIAEELIRVFELRPEKVRLIYNGFDLEELKKKGAEEVEHPWLGNRREPVVGTLGRMVELKGFNYLLEALKIVNEAGIPARLLMIGKGEMLENLKAIAERLNIRDKVEFLGFVDNPFAYLARCDVFVLSSLYEGLPSTLIEAMILGIPVISTNCPTGPEEIIEHEESGLLVPVADSAAIAKSIINVLSDKELDKRLRMKGRERGEYFSLENMVSQFAGLFTEVLDR